MNKLTFFALLIVVSILLASCSVVSIDAAKFYMGRLPAPEEETVLKKPYEKGSLSVGKFFYAGGVNPRRKEYSKETITVSTSVLDISKLVEKIDSGYWGYDCSSVPLNGIVWYPKEKGRYPLVLCIHGNHPAQEFSEAGYDYLGEHLASLGIIFVSVDENFLNGSIGNENDARAYVLLHHAKTILSWNNDPSNPLYGILDTQNIGIIGHSRGGEAVVHAASFNKLSRYPDNGTLEFDFNLPIRAVVSIAPIEGQYKPSMKTISTNNINYLVLHGSQDGDVFFFAGTRLYNSVQLSEEFIKASFWIYGANHAQFNSIWAEKQDPFPSLRSCLLSVEQQQKTAKTLITSFLLSSFKIEEGYREFFKTPRAYHEWMADTFYINSFAGGNERILADYNEDIELASVGLKNWEASAKYFENWSESKIWLISGDQNNWGTYLKWDTLSKVSPIPSYVLSSKDSSIKTDELAFDIFVYNVQDTNGATSSKSENAVLEMLNFTIRLTGSDEKQQVYSLREFLDIGKAPAVTVLNVRKDIRTVLQSVYIKLKESMDIQKIEFIFDKSKKGDILIDNIRYTEGGKSK